MRVSGVGENGVQMSILTSSLGDERRVQGDVVSLRPQLIQRHQLYAELQTLGTSGHRVVADRLQQRQTPSSASHLRSDYHYYYYKICIAHKFKHARVGGAGVAGWENGLAVEGMMYSPRGSCLASRQPRDILFACLGLGSASSLFGSASARSREVSASILLEEHELLTFEGFAVHLACLAIIS